MDIIIVGRTLFFSKRVSFGKVFVAKGNRKKVIEVSLCKNVEKDYGVPGQL